MSVCMSLLMFYVPSVSNLGLVFYSFIHVFIVARCNIRWPAVCLCVYLSSFDVITWRLFDVMTTMSLAVSADN